jgi:hypothetical protein
VAGVVIVGPLDPVAVVAGLFDRARAAPLPPDRVDLGCDFGQDVGMALFQSSGERPVVPVGTAGDA